MRMTFHMSTTTPGSSERIDMASEKTDCSRKRNRASGTMEKEELTHAQTLYAAASGESTHCVYLDPVSRLKMSAKRKSIGSHHEDIPMSLSQFLNEV